MLIFGEDMHNDNVMVRFLKRSVFRIAAQHRNYSYTHGYAAASIVYTHKSHEKLTNVHLVLNFFTIPILIDLKTP